MGFLHPRNGRSQRALYEREDLKTTNTLLKERKRNVQRRTREEESDANVFSPSKEYERVNKTGEMMRMHALCSFGDQFLSVSTDLLFFFAGRLKKKYQGLCLKLHKVHRYAKRLLWRSGASTKAF